MRPNTQKAKSIIYALPRLVYELSDGPADIHKLHVWRLIKNKKNIGKYNSTYINTFMRPCPSVPRHGFVESKILRNNNQLKETFEKVKSIDKNGEIILTEYIKAKYSAVYSTGGLLAIGPKNDGATAGKNSFSIPVAPTTLSKKVIKLSGIEDENAFIEMVFGAYGKGVLTQVRGGPKTQNTVDYIPKTVIVKKIVTPLEDLVEWEKQTKQFTHGTVVYGKGHTLSSHAAIHCVINKIPFITSSKPKIGKKCFKQKNNKEFKLNKYQFNKAVKFALKDNSSLESMFCFSAMVIHNWPYLNPSKEASWMLGISAVFMSKIICSLCLGELLYSDNTLPSGSRSYIYKNAAKYISKYIKKLPEAISIFKKDFISYGDTDFGGPPWIKASQICIKIWGELTGNNSKKLISLLNKSINLVHNGGDLFDKFISEAEIDFISDNSGLTAFILSNEIAKYRRKIFNV